MKIEFYNINTEKCEEIYRLLQVYNSAIKGIFSKETKDKMKLIKEKTMTEKEILKCLEESILLGSLTEEEFNSIDKEIKDKYLSENMTKTNDVESMYIDLQEKQDERYKKISTILKKSIKNNKNLFFWLR